MSWGYVEATALAVQTAHWWICGLTGRPYYLHRPFNQSRIEQSWDRLVKQSQDSTASVSASCKVCTLHFIVPALRTLFALYLQSHSHCFWHAVWLLVTAEKLMPFFISMAAGLVISQTIFQKDRRFFGQHGGAVISLCHLKWRWCEFKPAGWLEPFCVGFAPCAYVGLLQVFPPTAQRHAD